MLLLQFVASSAAAKAAGYNPLRRRHVVLRAKFEDCKTLTPGPMMLASTCISSSANSRRSCCEFHVILVLQGTTGAA